MQGSHVLYDVWHDVLLQSMDVRSSCVFAESSEALMPGRQPKVRLLVRAVDSGGHRLSAIPLLVSEEFVVRGPQLCTQ